jgi:hypothetical protein
METQFALNKKEKTTNQVVERSSAQKRKPKFAANENWNLIQKCRRQKKIDLMHR